MSMMIILLLNYDKMRMLESSLEESFKTRLQWRFFYCHGTGCEAHATAEKDIRNLQVNNPCR